MWIIQMADLHMNLGLKLRKQNKIIDRICDVLSKHISEDESVALTICGDLSNKGDKNNYKEIYDFIKKIENNIKCKRIDYVICPGNHDIVKDHKNEFKYIDEFLFDLTNSARIRFQKETVILETINNIDFIIANSSHHKEHEYGKVDIKALDKVLRNSSSKLKILVMHHHLIPVFHKDRSTTVNSYELLKLVEEHNVQLILHGHQHMSLQISMGDNKCNIIGVSSLLSSPSGNYNNKFNIFKVEDFKISKGFNLIYNSDSMIDGKLGGYIQKKLIINE